MSSALRRPVLSAGYFTALSIDSRRRWPICRSTSSRRRSIGFLLASTRYSVRVMPSRSRTASLGKGILGNGASGLSELGIGRPPHDLSPKLSSCKNRLNHLLYARAISCDLDDRTVNAVAAQIRIPETDAKQPGDLPRPLVVRGQLGQG